MHAQDVGQRAVVILGMHRSGTSLVTRGMKALGVELGGDLYPGDLSNPTGHWEDNAILNLNERLLARMERTALSIAPVRTELLKRPEIQALKIEALQTVRARFGNFPLWGFKDPRTARLLSFWQNVLRELGVADCYALVVRNPISVADSLKARYGFALEKSYLLWLEHYLAAYTHTNGKPRIVIDYDALMDDPAAALHRVAERLGLALGPQIEQAIKDYCDGFVDNSLRHSVYKPTDVAREVHAPHLVSKTYDLLRKVALDEFDTDGKEIQSAMACAQSGLEGLDPFFLYSELAEAERDSIRRERDSLAGQLQWTREQLQNAVAGRYVLQAENRVLMAATESQKPKQEPLRLENESARAAGQQRTDAIEILQLELRSLWNSRSWRLLKPLRNLARQRKGFGKETEPILHSEPELIQAIVTVRQSLCWELTAPLRLIYRFLLRH
jgi:hypothetical protein